jgi:hypothetical protein
MGIKKSGWPEKILVVERKEKEMGRSAFTIYRVG